MDTCVHGYSRFLLIGAHISTNLITHILIRFHICMYAHSFSNTHIHIHNSSRMSEMNSHRYTGLQTSSPIYRVVCIFVCTRIRSYINTFIYPIGQGHQRLVLIGTRAYRPHHFGLPPRALRIQVYRPQRYIAHFKHIHRKSFLHEHFRISGIPCMSLHHIRYHAVAMISRLLQMIGLFCRLSSIL